MAKDTITLALSGVIPFKDFASAINHLNNLVGALSADMGISEDIVWLVHDLQVSSAIATIRGEADSTEKVERVVSAYGKLGKELEVGQSLSFSDHVVREAHAITGILNGHVTSVRFETPDSDAIITSHPAKRDEPSTRITFGAIEGRVQTLTERKGLRFTLYDTFNDRAVSCYLQEEQKEPMRQIWGQRAIVEGEITRDTMSGRPIAVRHLTSIRIVSDSEKGSYLKARGVAPRKQGSPLPEVFIRELRDA